MAKKIYIFIYTLVALISLSACAGLSSMDERVSSKEARIIFFVPKTVPEEQLKKALYDAISYRVGHIQENEGLFPEELPTKPGSPKQSKMFRGLASVANGNPKFKMMQLDTSNAYYTVSGEGGYATQFNAQLEYYKAAIYPYSDGYKVYIYLFYQEGSDGIMGELTNKSVEAIIGERGALLYAAQIRDKFKELVPEAVIKSQRPRKLEKIILNDIGLEKSD